MSEFDVRIISFFLCKDNVIFCETLRNGNYHLKSVNHGNNNMNLDLHFFFLVFLTFCKLFQYIQESFVTVIENIKTIAE